MTNATAITCYTDHLEPTTISLGALLKSIAANLGKGTAAKVREDLKATGVAKYASTTGTIIKAVGA